MKERGGGQKFSIGCNGKTYLKVSSWILALWMEVYFGSMAKLYTVHVYSILYTLPLV